MTVFLLNNRGRSIQPPRFFLLRHFIKIHLEPRRLGVCAVVSKQLLCVLNTGFHARARPQNRYLPGLSASVERIQSLTSLWDPGPLPSPQQRWPAPGYHGNLLMLVPALPCFPTAPPDATGYGVCSSVPSHLAQWWSLQASVLGGGGRVSPRFSRGSGTLLTPTLGHLCGWQWAGKGCRDKIPQTGGLKQQIFISQSSGGWNLRSRCGQGSWGLSPRRVDGCLLPVS